MKDEAHGVHSMLLCKTVLKKVLSHVNSYGTHVIYRQNVL